MFLDAIDAAYSNEHVTLAVGLSIVTLIVFADAVVVPKYYWGLLNAVFLGTLLMYDANPVLPLMMAALVGASSPRRL